MQRKKDLTRTDMPMSELLNTPLIDPRDPGWGNDLLQAQREMNPVHFTTLSPVEYMIFSGKGPSLLADPFEK
jgi:hypothetical protein